MGSAGRRVIVSGALQALDSDGWSPGVGSLLMVLVAKYRDLDVESAARLHSASAGLAQHLPASSSAVSGAVVVSTCNRFEIYCEVPSAAEVSTARSDALDAVGIWSGLPVSRLSALFEQVTGPAATEHLFAVTAGLDSIVVGEREVSGQVRRAFAAARTAGTAGGRLGRLFEAASRTARDVGAQAAFNTATRSIASVALDLAASRSGLSSLADVSVVLFGTGSYGACVMEILRSRQCAAVGVFSQSGRADAFVAARGGSAVSAGQLPVAVAGADIIIGCSGSGTRVDSATLARWREGAVRPLTVIDLAPSHDFDPLVAGIPGIELITLATVQCAAPAADAEALRLARALVREAARRFEEQEAGRLVDTAVVVLRRHVHQVLEAEMERAVKQHGCGAAADEVNFALRRLVRRLLHLPTVRARELAVEGRQEEFVAALDALFGLRDQFVSPSEPVGCQGTSTSSQLTMGRRDEAPAEAAAS